MSYVNFKNSLFLSLLIGCNLKATAPQTSLQLGAYYENWSQYRTTNPNNPTKGVFPSCIPQGLFTVAANLNIFNYAFWIFNYNDQPPQGQTTPVGITNDWKVYPTEWNDITPWNDGGLLAQAADLKKINSNLKVMASIGGWNFVNSVCDGGNSYGCKTYNFFTDLLYDANGTGTLQQSFIDSLCAKGTSSDNAGYFWKKTPQGNQYYLDGIDLDYEYPGQYILTNTGENPGGSNDYQGYINFIQKLRAAINTINATGERPKLYLSITLPPFLPSNLAPLSGGTVAGVYPAGTPLAGKNYPSVVIDPTNPSTYFAWLSIVANHCDWVNLMTYDMYGAGFSNELVQYQCPLTNTYSPYDATKIPDNSKCGAYSLDYAVWMWTVGAKQGVASLTDNVGIEASRIQLGLPAYGRSYGSDSFPFDTKNPILQNYGGGSGGFAQPFTKQSGVAAYCEITALEAQASRMSLNTNPVAGLGNSPTQAQSFLVVNGTKNSPANNVFVYDSPADIATKVKWAQAQGLGGVFFYAISEDNFPINAPLSQGYNPASTLFKAAADVIAQPKSNYGGSVNQSTRTPQ